MHVDDALRFIEDTLVKEGGRRLTDVQRAVFRGSWDDRGYKEIPKLYRLSCSENYLKRDVGPELWQLLSRVLGEEVTKKKLRGSIERAYDRLTGLVNQISDAPAIEPPVREPSTSNGLTPASNLEAMRASPSQSSSRPTSPQQEWDTRVPDVTYFQGRERELEELCRWLTIENCRLLLINGIAGIGKTYLSVRLAQRVREQFEYLIWRSMAPVQNQPLPLAELLTDLISFFSQGAETEGSLPRLIYYLRNHACAIVLDGFELVLRAGVHDGSYLPGYEAYGELLKQLGETAHQSRVILTSREKPRQIASVEGESKPVRAKKLTGMGEQAIIQMFASRSEGVFEGKERDWRTLISRCDGHPLMLNDVATQIVEMFNGQVGEFLKQMQQDSLISSEIRGVFQQQLDRLSSLEQTIISTLSAHPEPIEVDNILQRLPQPFSRIQLLEGLQSLRRRSLLEVEGTRYSLPPLLGECFRSPT